MANMVHPTKILGVTLLHKCNFHCAHCGYLYTAGSDDHDIKPGYRLTMEQIQKVIADCNSIKGEDQFGFIVNGGEPTLWEEGDLKLIDVLLAIDKGGIIPNYNTNGSYFSNYDQCHDFFHRYSEEGNLPLMTFVSIDKFHDNYDREKGRAESLDNIVRVLDQMPADKREVHRVGVVTIVSKDPKSYLPEEMKEFYGTKGIGFGSSPLQPIGRAKELKDEIPDMEEFFKNAPPPKRKLHGGMPIATLIGEYYNQGGEKVAKLGELKDWYSTR